MGDGRGAAMEEKVDQSNQLSVGLRDQRMNRFCLVKESVPSEHGHSWRKGSGANTAVKFIPSLARSVGVNLKGGAALPSRRRPPSVTR